jgi:hypothetical protein
MTARKVPFRQRATGTRIFLRGTSAQGCSATASVICCWGSSSRISARGRWQSAGPSRCSTRRRARGLPGGRRNVDPAPGRPGALDRGRRAATGSPSCIAAPAPGRWADPDQVLSWEATPAAGRSARRPTPLDVHTVGRARPCVSLTLRSWLMVKGAWTRCGSAAPIPGRPSARPRGLVRGLVPERVAAQPQPQQRLGPAPGLGLSARARLQPAVLAPSTPAPWPARQVPAAAFPLRAPPHARTGSMGRCHGAGHTRTMRRTR